MTLGDNFQYARVANGVKNYIDGLPTEERSGLKLVTGCDDLLFEGNIEDAPVEMAIRRILRLRLNDKLFRDLLLPAWFRRLMKENQSELWAPQNFQEIFRSCGRLAGLRLRDENLAVEEIIRLDQMLMEWNIAFFRQGVLDEGFVERNRWFKGMTPDRLRESVRDLILCELQPLVRQKVFRLVNGLSALMGAELHVLSGTVQEIVETAVCDSRCALNVPSDKIHASELLFDETRRFTGASVPMHPARKGQKADELGARLAVVPKRNAKLSDPMTASVLSRGGIVLAV